ncbi:MAG TPA: hypothetical protein VFE36_16975 [Candidatus Baltobacteraceae bacterium]|nr:hypothetical protein [Candidatus Baltobacteraceae bacterium]
MAVALATIASARIESGVAPIAVQDCHVTVGRRTIAALEFVNRETSPADAVGILVSYNGVEQRIVDRGTFSHEIVIRHWFGVQYAPSIGAGTEAKCNVYYAHFANGYTWPGASQE